MSQNNINLDLEDLEDLESAESHSGRGEHNCQAVHDELNDCIFILILLVDPRV